MGLDHKGHEVCSSPYRTRSFWSFLLGRRGWTPRLLDQRLGSLVLRHSTLGSLPFSVSRPSGFASNYLLGVSSFFCR